MTLIEWDNHNGSESESENWELGTTHIVLHNAAIRMLNPIRLGPPIPLPAVLQTLRLLLPATISLLLRRPAKICGK